MCAPYENAKSREGVQKKIVCSGKKWHDQVFAFYIFILGQQIKKLCQTNKPIMSNF